MTHLVLSEAKHDATKWRPTTLGNRPQIQHVVGRKVNQQRLKQNKMVHNTKDEVWQSTNISYWMKREHGARDN